MLAVVAAVIITRIAKDALRRAVDESASDEAVVLVASDASDADVESPLVVKIDSPEPCAEGPGGLGGENSEAVSLLP